MNSIQQDKGEVIIISPFLVFSIQKDISGQIKRNKIMMQNLRKNGMNEPEYLIINYKGINNSNMYHKMQRL
jgi:hypothetical protein